MSFLGLSSFNSLIIITIVSNMNFDKEKIDVQLLYFVSKMDLHGKNEKQKEIEELESKTKNGDKKDSNGMYLQFSCKHCWNKVEIMDNK